MRVPGTVLHNGGGVKCQQFLKHSYHWKQALKMEPCCLASSFLANSTTTVAKVSLFSYLNAVYSKFSLCVGVETGP